MKKAQGKTTENRPRRERIRHASAATVDCTPEPQADDHDNPRDHFGEEIVPSMKKKKKGNDEMSVEEFKETLLALHAIMSSGSYPTEAVPQEIIQMTTLLASPDHLVPSQLIKTRAAIVVVNRLELATKELEDSESEPDRADGAISSIDYVTRRCYEIDHEHELDGWTDGELASIADRLERTTREREESEAEAEAELELARVAVVMSEKDRRCYETEYYETVYELEERIGEGKLASFCESKSDGCDWDWGANNDPSYTTEIAFVSDDSLRSLFSEYSSILSAATLSSECSSISSVASPISSPECSETLNWGGVLNEEAEEYKWKDKDSVSGEDTEMLTDSASDISIILVTDYGTTSRGKRNESKTQTKRPTKETTKRKCNKIRKRHTEEKRPRLHIRHVTALIEKNHLTAWDMWQHRNPIHER